MKFIDIFAGLGGFHKGLTNAGGFECVFASELDSDLRKLYYKNYGIVAEGDITKIDEKLIPDHDILCAGFPCQPFSLAGKKIGSKCPKSGKLIDDIVRITKYHLPEFVILENVPNILTIEDGKFWKYIKKSFNKIDYSFTYKIISPENVGIPQNRRRIFMLGCRNKQTLESFKWPNNNKIKKQKLATFLKPKKPNKQLELAKIRQVECWQHFLDKCGITHLPSISIVAPEFNATYPLNFQNHSLKDMHQYRGSYGVNLEKCRTWNELIENLPSYTRNSRKVPEWLLKSVKYSRNLYAQRNMFLDKWLPTLDKRYNSWQILEWRGHSRVFNFSDHILQFRASGIRLSKKEKAPSFIAMTPTQVPIIGSEMRYMSKYEVASLQCLGDLPYLPDNDTKAFKALGNAVNAKIVEAIAKNLKSNLKQSL